MMNDLIYVLGSGILDHPARWWILGMAFSGAALVTVLLWTVLITLCIKYREDEHRNLKSILGVIAVILLFVLFSFFESRYNEVMQDKEDISTELSSPVCDWVYEVGSNGHIYIYEYTYKK